MSTPGGNEDTDQMANASHPPWLYIGIGCGIAALALLIFFLICFCCLCYRYKQRRKGKEDEEAYGLLMEEVSEKKKKREDEVEKKRGKKQRDKERKKQEEQEVGLSERVMQQFSQDRAEQYLIKERLPELGSRLQKHWYQGCYRDGSNVIATEAPRTKHCRLPLTRSTLDTINTNLLPSIRQHPFIQPVHEIIYLLKEDKILTVQPLITRGTLRDYMFQESNPLLDWSKKYSKAHGLTMDKVSLFGRQILEGVTFLYKLGFPPLGHIHSGNIMLLGDDYCRLGGYENTLLGYRTRLYQQCNREGYLNSIDIIMFGHVMYEMSYGREMNDVLPQEEDYLFPVVEHRERLEEIIAYIFDKKNQTSFKQITSHKFFAGSRLGAIPQIEISKKAKRLLEDLSKGVGRGAWTPPSSPGPEQETRETKKTPAQENVKEFVETSQAYDSESVKHFPEIGRRVGKYWSKIKTSGIDGPTKQVILSISSLPESCPIHLTSSTEKTLNFFFAQIQHPCLHRITDLHYVRESHQVILARQMVEKGSIRDHILATNPLANWTMKLQVGGSPLTGKVALYGRQILEAVSFLYEQGFPPLGHLHTGNLFLEVDRGGSREVCRVAGYENTLLGFRTCQGVFAHQRYSDAIDLWMFGHVIYEMSTGRVLEQEVPTDSDYASVKRDSVREVLSFIFSMSDSVTSGAMSYKEGLQRVKGHSFFIASAQSQVDLDFNSTEVVVSEDMKQLLEKVRSKRKGVSGMRKILKKLETVTSIS